MKIVSMEQSASQISRENTKSRRFSASNLKSFRDDERYCLRSSTRGIYIYHHISSTASSPGYMHTTREEIDPSTYSFTAALKALQAKAVYSWEYLPSHSHRLTLHSKWSDAEKYISNPLSGEVPLECLSASARSFSNRITISAPLIYHTNYPIIQHHHKLNITIPAPEKKRCTTKDDAGTQSPAANVSSGSPSPVPTPSIQERPKKHSEGEFGDSISVASEKEKSEGEQVEEREAKEKEGRERERKTKMMMMKCREGGGRRGCLSLKGLWKRDKCKCKPRKNNNPSSSPTFLYHINACFDQ